MSINFKELEARFNEYSDNLQSILIKFWMIELNRAFMDKSREVSPFKGLSKKSAFGANADKKNSKIMTIWGARPNVGDDPAIYPLVPAPGFRQADEYSTLDMKPFGLFRTSRKIQEHWKGDSIKAYNSDGAKWIYSLKDRRYGARVYGIWGERKVSELYSVRSIPKLIEDYPGLDSVIMGAFEAALAHKKFKKALRREKRSKNGNT